MGQQLIPLRGQGPWRGRSTQGKADQGQRRLIRIEGGYVSADGTEIRQMPGFHTILDLSPENNTSGYERVIRDAVLPTVSVSPSPSVFYFHAFQGTPDTRRQTLYAWAPLEHLHCFEVVRDTLLVVGEAGARRVHIMSSTRVPLTVTSVRIATAGPHAFVWHLTMSATPDGYTSADADPLGTPRAAMNGLQAGDTVIADDIDVSGNPTMQALADATLNGRVHEVYQISGTEVILKTNGGGGAISAEAALAGTLNRCRGSRRDVYTPGGAALYNDADPYGEPDDPPALTSWRVTAPLDLDNPAQACQPAWVANRMRDFGDDPGGFPTEGVYPITNIRGVSRRQQRQLPFRVNPDVAGDRLLLAAPGYACLFQVPVVVPIDPENWPDTPPGWSPRSGRGVPALGNDIHDRPRALGVPKAQVLDSTHITPVIASPTPAAWNLNTYAAVVTGFPAGTYRVYVTWVDMATGEEGLPSEPIELTIPAGFGGLPGIGIQLTLYHPGYVFPECLALAANIYLQVPGSDQIGFYRTITFQGNSAVYGDVSAKYGFAGGFSPEAGEIAKTWLVPLPINTSPITQAIDVSRAPVFSAQMPRGGECVRTVRGITFGLGHSGTHGGSSEMLLGYASALYYDDSGGVVGAGTRAYYSPNEIQIRIARTPLIETTPPVSPDVAFDGPWGLASRWFPPAYQGLELWSRDLFPEPRRFAIVDRVINPKTCQLDTASHPAGLARALRHQQRLLLRERLYDPNLGSPSSPAAVLDKINLPTYLKLPRGQIQVSEPGRPWTMLANTITFLDAAKDDDGVAAQHWRGGLLICSRRETYWMSWGRAPGGDLPRALSFEHGCIGTNTMVEFDGGTAWLSERGPIAATGEGLLWLNEIERDFYGSERLYRSDSRGMMRHAWAHHDKARGLVMWGLISKDSTHTISYRGQTLTWDQADDRAKSRFPCNVVLIWSYRANAFSTWRPPSGLEILWMRDLRDNNGDTYTCFLAADGRIYAFNENWHDTNREIFESTPTTVQLDGSTSLKVSATWAVDGSGGATARGTGENLLRAGMSVLVIRHQDDGTEYLAHETTIASLDVASQTITLAAAATWTKESRVQIGHRSALVVETAFAGDGWDNLSVDAVHARYSLHGESDAWCKAEGKVTDLQSSPRLIGWTEDPSEYRRLGVAQSEPVAMRRRFAEGRAEGAEINVKLTFRGAAHVRLGDIALEVAT